MRTAVALILLASPALADEPIEAPGEVIVISGLRLPRSILDTPPAVTVIDRDQLARSPGALVDDVVRAVPSVGTFRRSSSMIADPTSQGLNLRGVGPSGVSRALVLRDGIPENDPFGGWVYWRAISPLGLDRIEIAPSGASALFGDFALGGVMQLVSRPITERAATATLAGGSLGTGRGAARVTDRIGAYGIALEADAFRTAGYTPVAPDQRGAVDHPAASSHGALAARLERPLGETTLYVTARGFRESLDAGTDHTSADVSTLALAAGARAPRYDIAVFGGSQLFEQERARVAPDRSTASTSSEQRTPSADQGAMASYQLQAGPYAILVGGDARRITGTATDQLSPAMVEPDSLVERSAGGEQQFAGVFVQDALALGAIELAAAVRLDAWRNLADDRSLVRASGERTAVDLPDSSGVQIDPRASALAHLTEVIALRASAYRAFRAPTLNELYRPFQVGTVLTDANPMLEAETLWGAEAGPQFVTSGIVVRATGFYNRLERPIANVTLAEPTPSGAMRQRQNLGAARIAGMEIDASWRPAPAWTAEVAHTVIATRVTDAPAQPELVGKRLAQDPDQRTVAALTYDAPAFALITAQVRHLGRQFEDDLNTLPIGAVVLFDARIARRLGHGLYAFATGTNLFDRHYLVGRAGVDTIGAPRMLELGIGYDSQSR